MRAFQIAFGGALLLGYAAASLSGWGPSPAPREVIPADVRSAPGGYRSFHFWHSGYRGGK
jgi:hypothetical protein